MTSKHAKLNRTWTVAEAKARLSEILRLAEEEGPPSVNPRTSGHPELVRPVLIEVEGSEADGPANGSAVLGVRRRQRQDSSLDPFTSFRASSE